MITAQAAREAGVTPAAVRWAIRTRELLVVRRGCYVPAQAWASATPRARHLLQVVAAQAATPGGIACGESAASLLRLPLPDGPPARPLLVIPASAATLGRGGTSSGTEGPTIRRAQLGEDEVFTLGRSRVAVTTPARTVVDCSRHLPLAWALAVADAAMHKWRVSSEDLLAAARRRPFAPGHRAALWVATHARPQVESPLESLARFVLIMAGYSHLVPQVWVTTDLGPFRVDLMDDLGVVIEADGRVKYEDDDEGAALGREKKRQDAIRDTGAEVVRFTMADHHRPTPFLARYARARARAERASLLKTS